MGIKSAAIVACGCVTTSKRGKGEGPSWGVAFDRGQVEVIRLSAGETSPSDKAGVSVLSSCYKTDWPTAIGRGGGGAGVIGTIHSKDGNLRKRGVTREFGF